MIGSNGENEIRPRSTRLDQFFIPSSLVSRIGSPLNNFLEIPFMESLPMSFLYEEQESSKSETTFKVNSSQSTATNQSELLKELEIIRIQVDKIKEKLEINMQILKDKENAQQELKQQIISKFNSEKLSKNTDILESVSINCACSKGCEIC